MFSKALSASVLGLVASSLVSAQTFTKCDPLEKKCPDNPAAKPHVKCDLGRGCGELEVEGMPSAFKKEHQGLACAITGDKQAPTMITPNYIFFGRVDVVVQAAPGQGIVTSVVLQSDDRDEIDWEWIGSDNAQVQSNYYSKGRAEPYDRGAYHKVANPVGQFHKYSIEWTSQSVVWSINDAPVRTLNYDSADKGNAFPQTPMQVKLGTWVAGGKDSSKGTVDWAGGRTDFSQAPFTGYYQSINIVNYNGKDHASDSDANTAHKYVWGDHSGSWQSIKVVEASAEDVKDGNKNNQEDDEDSKDNSSSHTESMTRGVGDNSSSETSAASSKTKSSPSITDTTGTTSSSGESQKVATARSGSSGATSTLNPVTTTANPAGAAYRDTSAYGQVVLAGVCALLGQFLL